MTLEEAIQIRGLQHRVGHRHVKSVRGRLTEWTAAGRVLRGARESVTAHGLHRPTHERPGADLPSADPTQRWCSDCGKERANVTGKSARAVGLHPSLALGPACTEAAADWSGQTFNGHPAETMEQA